MIFCLIGKSLENLPLLVNQKWIYSLCDNWNNFKYSEQSLCMSHISFQDFFFKKRRKSFKNQNLRFLIQPIVMQPLYYFLICLYSNHVPVITKRCIVIGPLKIMN